MEQLYKGFQAEHIQHLKLLADSCWWMLQFNGEPWILKGKAVSGPNDEGNYAVLLSDMREVWIGFPHLEVSDEATKFNPNIQGGIRGVLNILNGLIEKQDPQAKYEILMLNSDVCEFEITKLLNNIFNFSWVIRGNKLPAQCAKKLLFDYFISPLIRTLNVQEKRLEQLDSAVNQKTPRTLTELRRFAHERKSLNSIEFSTSSSLLMSEFHNLQVQTIDEEICRQEINRKRPAQGSERSNVKRAKVASAADINVDYEESKEERLRKIELEQRLKGKQRKDKVDFL